MMTVGKKVEELIAVWRRKRVRPVFTLCWRRSVLPWTLSPV
jgi:hypothetical protein